MTTFISEVFAEMRAAKTKVEKIEILRKHNSPALRLILTEYFTAKFIKVTKPKYRADVAPIGLNPSHLFKASKQLYVFHEDFQLTNPEKRRNRVLVQLLESMCAEESKTFLGILQHKLKVPGLTEALVLEALPGLFTLPEKTVRRITKKKPKPTPTQVEK